MQVNEDLMEEEPDWEVRRPLPHEQRSIPPPLPPQDLPKEQYDVYIPLLSPSWPPSHFDEIVRFRFNFYVMIFLTNILYCRRNCSLIPFKSSILMMALTLFSQAVWFSAVACVPDRDPSDTSAAETGGLGPGGPAEVSEIPAG